MGGMGPWQVGPGLLGLCASQEGVTRVTKEPWDLERLFSKVPPPKKLRLKSEYQLRLGHLGRRNMPSELLVILMRKYEVLQKVTGCMEAQ